MLLCFFLLYLRVRFRSHWRESGRPTLLIAVTNETLLHGARTFPGLLMQLHSGSCSGVRVQIGRFRDMENTSCIERLAFLDDPRIPLSKLLDASADAALKTAASNPQELLKFDVSQTMDRAGDLRRAAMR